MPAPPGIIVTAADVQLMAGSIARNLHIALQEAVEFNKFLAPYTDVALSAAFTGLSTGDATVIKSAYNADTVLLNDIFRGNAMSTTQKNYSAFLGKLWGMGNV